jgi:membrane fusion protein (multidrug efflux system)
LIAPQLGRVGVTLVLEDGSVYPHAGHLDFLDLAIDEATGTAAIRAEVPNPQRTLLPGQFVRARIEVGVRANTFLVPQRAVQLSATGASAFVVDSNDVVAVRPIKTGPLRGADWVVLDGLRAGDRVIVDGIQKIRPGAKVRIAATADPAPGAPSTTPER